MKPSKASSVMLAIISGFSNRSIFTIPSFLVPTRWKSVSSSDSSSSELLSLLESSAVTEIVARGLEVICEGGMRAYNSTVERPALEALTLDEVNRVAAELYDPEALHFVVVGQPERLETQ